MHVLYEPARAVGRELGLDLGEGSTGGNDGLFTSAMGTPTLDVDDIPRRAAPIGELIRVL